MGHVATTGGITAEDIRDLIVATVEHRLGPVNRLASPIKWPRDKGGPYVADDTRRFAHDIGLVPRTTPVSPATERHGRSFRADPQARLRSREPHARRTHRHGAATRRLTHYIEVHQHKKLRYQSPPRVHHSYPRGLVRQLGGNDRGAAIARFEALRLAPKLQKTGTERPAWVALSGCGMFDVGCGG
jgi:hypothetical protein